MAMKGTALLNGENILFEAHVVDEIYATLDALC